MDSEKKLSVAIVDSVQNKRFSELGKIATETGIDSILSSGLLKDLPVVNIIASITQVGFSISDRIFTKKLFSFFISLSSLSNSERNSMIQRLHQEEEYRNKVGERIIEILDRIDSHRKPQMIGHLFIAYVQNKIDFSMFRKLNNAIERLPYYEIDHLRKFKNTLDENQSKTFDEITLNQFVAAGLAIPVSAWDGMLYNPTNVCEKFLELDLDK